MRKLIPVVFAACLIAGAALKQNGEFLNAMLKVNSAVPLPLLDDLYIDRGVYVMRENGTKYIVSIAPETSCEFEAEQLTELFEYASAQNTDFLYVNAPCKCLLDDSIVSEYFGISSYSNANADRLFAMLRECGVPYLDLRENVKAEGKDILDLFYRMDHHWRAETGLWAVGLTADELNARYSFGLDTACFSPDYYSIKVLKDAWIGEQGQLFSSAYAGYDSFTVIQPNQNGNYSVQSLGENDSLNHAGDFSILLDPCLMNEDPSDDAPGHYAYCPHNLYDMRYINQDLPDGKKILLLCDSFSNVTVPFLLQGVRQIDTAILRTSSCDVKQMLAENDYDAVIVLYSQAMIGAHDDCGSANYKMFDFFSSDESA